MLPIRISAIDQYVEHKSGHAGGIYMKGKKLILVLICTILISSLSVPIQAEVSVIRIPVSTGGSGHTLAIMNDGTLWGWGYNYQHQLGSATHDNLTTPVKIMDGAVSVAAGSMHSLAVKSDGSLSDGAAIRMGSSA